jgi:DNA-binding transcriptional regulator GbsR (MarR family)
MRYNVFISYSTKDLEKVNVVKKILERTKDIDVFVAEYSVKPFYVEQFPIVKPQTNRLTNKVDQILTVKQDNPKADTSELEAEIDRLVYALYGLSEEEIEIVEGSIG